MEDDWTHMDFCSLQEAPEIQGVYFLMNEDELVYIGQSNNIRRRLSSHNSNWNCQLYLNGEKLEEDSFDSLYYFECKYKPERKIYEEMFIKDYCPKLNFDDWMNYSMILFADLMRKEFEKREHVEGWRPEANRFTEYANR